MTYNSKRRFAWPLLGLCVLLTSACDQLGLSSKNNNPFAGRQAARMVAIVTLDMTYEEAKLAIESNNDIDDRILRIFSYSYDELGRVESTELLRFSRDSRSAYSDLGALVFSSNLVYRTDAPWQTDLVTMESWDTWADEATPPLLRRTVSTMLWEGNLQVGTEQEIISYDGPSGEEQISGTHHETIQYQYNSQGYRIAELSTNDVELYDGLERDVIYTRANDGVRLEYMQSDIREMRFFYNANGSVSNVEEHFIRSGQTNEHIFREYEADGGEFFILVEVQTSFPDGYSFSNVELYYFTQGFCHESNWRAQTGYLPHYFNCVDFKNWR